MGDSRDDKGDSAWRDQSKCAEAEEKPRELDTLLSKKDDGCQVIIVGENEKLKIDDSHETSEKAPTDKYYFVFMIFVLHGVAILMPWNMFINAFDYFKFYKLSPPDTVNATIRETADTYRMFFMNAVTFAAQIPSMLLNGINLFCQCKGGGSSHRIVWSIVCVAAMFIITIVLAMVDSSMWPAEFFWATMVSVVLINSANGVYQNSVYGLAARLPIKYTNAILLGSNSSGALVSVLALITTAATQDYRTYAIYYFLTAVFVLVVAFDVYFALPNLEFYNYYMQKSTDNHAVSDEYVVTEHYLMRYWTVFKQTWIHDLSVFFVFFVTLSCFPTVMSGIELNDCNFPIPQRYFVGIACFLLFNVFAMTGSIIANFTQKPGARYTWIIVLLRGLFIPFFLFCNYNPSDRTLPVLFGNDYVYCLGGVLMALSSGYCSSLSMMFASRDVADKHKGVAGMMAACCLICGLFFGCLFTFALTPLVSIAGSSSYNSLVCDPVIGNTTAMPYDLVTVSYANFSGIDVLTISP